MASPFINFGFGLQRIIDAGQNFLGGAQGPVYLRLRNFPDPQTQQWSQLGFSITPSGSNVGTTDILIQPQPIVTMLTQKNIMKSAGKLRFGARSFMISGTFVQTQVVALGLPNQMALWNSSKIVGLYSDNVLFSIEEIQHKDVALDSVFWDLICNANEIR